MKCPKNLLTPTCLRGNAPTYSEMGNAPSIAIGYWLIGVKVEIQLAATRQDSDNVVHDELGAW